MYRSSRYNPNKLSVDYITVLLYLLLVAMGWVSIFSAVYNPMEGGSVFDLSERYGMQLVWIGVSFVLAIFIMLLDKRYFHLFAYHIYWVALLLMVGVVLFGKEVNGAKSWIGVGSIGIQPVEFMKIASALALARFMSSYHFSSSNRKTIVMVGLLIFLPIILVLMQNDTGSALVFGAFFFVLYREGVGASIYLVTLLFIALGILSFFLTNDALVILIFLLCVICELMSRHRAPIFKPLVRYLAMVLGVFMLLGLVSTLCGISMSVTSGLLISVVATLPYLIWVTLKGHSRTVLWYFALFIAGVVFLFVVDYAFENVLQQHQRERILDLVGAESDPRGVGYNAMQSKIAIGSGGVAGKGFLQGTQTRFSFVPEQSTDFIFCTVGEEWGFVGSAVVLLLFAALIFRLMSIAEKQKEPFARIYCYSAAMILLIHVLINISMAIGIFPIIGIPLPFFSYGGSSLMAFTILLFIALRVRTE